MDQELDTSPTVSLEPMACSEPPVHREAAFTDLLLNLSHKMSSENVQELSFVTECGLTGTLTALEVLKELRNQGVFSARSCANLDVYLRRIQRCDLADLVGQYMEVYPPNTADPPQGKRHTSVQEKGNRIPVKRSATGPASLSHQPHDTAQPVAATGERAQVYQEQTIVGNSELHVSSGCLSTRQVTSTPKHENYSHSQASSSGIIFDAPEHNPIAHNQPQTSPVEPVPRTVRRHRKSSSYDRFTHSSFPGKQCHPTSSFQGSQASGQSSRSATVSRESSFRSDRSSSSHLSSVKDTASQIAHMAIDMITHISQEHLSDEWYKSNSSYSLSSMSSSARAHAYSDTSSFCSESESVHSKPWSKKQSHSFHGTHSSRTAHSVMERRLSTPPRYQDNERTREHRSRKHTTQRTTAAEEVDSEDVVLTGDKRKVPVDSSVMIAEAENATLRPKKVQGNGGQSESQRHSVISDATPRQSVFSEIMRTRTQSMSSDATPRQSMNLEATPGQSVVSEATSDGTITSPRTSIYGRESVQDIGEMSTDEHTEQQKPNPSLKEKSLLRRKFSFFRSKPRTNVSPSFTWRVAREDLIKPVWRHQDHCSITRPGKFELNLNFGKHNPKLLFLLYPTGLFQDSGKAVTMAVRITTPDKCPPLPPSSEIHLGLVVSEGESGEIELKRYPTITEKLSMSIFYVFTLITHDQLKDSRSKNFHLDVEVSCSGVHRESLV